MKTVSLNWTHNDKFNYWEAKEGVITCKIFSQDSKFVVMVTRNNTIIKSCAGKIYDSLEKAQAKAQGSLTHLRNKIGRWYIYG